MVKNKRAVRLIVVAVLMLFSPPVIAQLTELADMPPGVTNARDIAQLRSNRARLSVYQRSLQRVGKIFMDDCGGQINKQSAKWGQCQRQYDQWQSDRQKFNQEAAEFNRSVNAAVQRSKSQSPEDKNITRWKQLTDEVETSGKLRDAIRGSGAPGASESRTHVLLDALEVGGGDWGKSLNYLVEAGAKFPDDLNIRDADKYFEGLTFYLSETECRECMDRRMNSLLFDYNFLYGLRDPNKGLDYQAFSLVQRANKAWDKAIDTNDWDSAARLMRQAHELKPDHLKIRDNANYLEGLQAAAQNGLGQK